MVPRLRTASGLVLLAASTLLSCGRGGGGEHGGAGGDRRQAGAPAQRPPVPVQAVEAVQRDVPETLPAVGTVQPSVTIAIRPLVTGAVVQVFFRDGDEVRAGQKLFQIDPRPFQAALAQAQANLAHTRAQAANARADVARYQPLVKGGYVTPQQYETAQSTARSLDADVRGLQAAIRKARLDLSHCLITSPVEGRTGAILVQPGNVVEANQTAPLVVISTLRPVYVAFSAPERFVDALRRGLGRMAVTAQATGQPRAGTLTFVNNAVDPTAGTIIARATFPNQDEALWPGAFVNVQAVLGVRRGAVTIPPAALVTSQSGQSVFVVKPDRTVELRPVQVVQASDQVAVVGKGLSAGEQVVTDGQLDLAPGARVAPRAPGAPAGPAVARDGHGGAGAGGTGAGTGAP